MMGKKKILVIDDERKIVDLITAYLENADFQVYRAFDGAAGQRVFRSSLPDLVILDLMLPEMDGIDLARLIRKESDVPIIMLTAKVDEVDRLVGLELGADDYVTKPFSPRELVARVRAVLRRYDPKLHASQDILRAGQLTIDPRSRKVSVDGNGVHLTALQFDLFIILARNPGRVFSRSELLELSLGESLETYERTVDAHIKNIRKALGVSPKAVQYIHTVHGVGYRFDAETH